MAGSYHNVTSQAEVGGMFTLGLNVCREEKPGSFPFYYKNPRTFVPRMRSQGVQLVRYVYARNECVIELCSKNKSSSLTACWQGQEGFV